MAASVAELILARVAAVLLSATSAGASVHRARDDGFGGDELPAINIRRSDTSGEPRGDTGQIESVEWEIEHHVIAATGADAETAADALHMEVHALLAADALLASKGRGLRCLGTSLQTAAADQVGATLTARYRMQVFVRPGDLTRAIT